MDVVKKKKRGVFCRRRSYGDEDLFKLRRFSNFRFSIDFADFMDSMRCGFYIDSNNMDTRYLYFWNIEYYVF